MLDVPAAVDMAEYDVGCDDFGDDDLGDAEALQALTNVENTHDEKPCVQVKVSVQQRISPYNFTTLIKQAGNPW